MLRAGITLRDGPAVLLTRSGGGFPFADLRLDNVVMIRLVPGSGTVDAAVPVHGYGSAGRIGGFVATGCSTAGALVLGG
jgi:hypothetical protein